MALKNAKIIIGIHVGHDRSVSAVKNEELIGHLAEERVDRIKHSPSVDFPKKALYSLLAYLRIDFHDVHTFVITYAFVHIDRIIENLAEEFRQEFNLPEANIIGVSHHLAHAYSAFYTSPFNEALILIADGAGDLTSSEKLESETAYISCKNKISLLWQRTQDIPSSYAERRNFYHPDYILDKDKNKQISIARKYEQITYTIGFQWGQNGKTMGLAPFGESISTIPKRKFNNDEVVDIRVKDLIYDFKSKSEAENISYQKFSLKYRDNIAATGQLAVEEAVMDILRILSCKTKIRNLCLAGGLFLNCVMNHKISENTDFKNIHICPAAGDDGQSIGAAFYGYYKNSRQTQRKKYSFTPYLGISYENEEVKVLLRNLGYKYHLVTKETIADLLSTGMIGGFLRGRSEAGPRALGNRSILAAPFASETMEHLNRYVKQREIFRPFAPIVTAEEQFTYFDLAHRSPYMLFCAPIKEEYRSRLKAISHVDSSARVQAVDHTQAPFIHSLLVEMGKQTGFPILLNTSFNGKGEPIVETPRDALSTFERTNLDFLVIEDFLILPDGWPNVPQEDSRWKVR
jgi:carbamoyltransferase